MPVLRTILTVATVLGILVSPFDWGQLPMMYPSILGFLPDWVFTTPGLISLVLLVAYISAEVRNIRRWLQYKWLSPERAARCLRHHFGKSELDYFAAMIDFPVEQGGCLADVAMDFLEQGVSNGHVAMRGKLENGSSLMRVPTPLQDHTYSRVQHRPPSEAQIGSDGNTYVDLEFRRSDIKKWVKKIRKDEDAKSKNSSAEGKN
ncbi:hypothetical protein [Actibacterium sp. MT2.3-13A]|uniref:hypothetical protein n=1 Tax=Actibacterium sp. MT2.3-13A TaxID=2828332 RepID=UPI001BA63054|nr:hypothetical protein [Actibacterium sp. MT2.3-13A]